jgi:pyrroloquinoline quinone biosynthesis protein B
MQLQVCEVIGGAVFRCTRCRCASTCDNGPWGQLVALGNISWSNSPDASRIELAPRLAVTPFRVPHRDEYSETVGFTIAGPERKVVYIPDIDKWDKWTTRLETLLESVDVAYLDGTFYDAGELPGRDMSEIPHPFIQETLQRLAALPAEQRAKVRFIHLNHTTALVRWRSSTGDRSRRNAWRRAGTQSL